MSLTSSDVVQLRLRHLELLDSNRRSLNQLAVIVHVTTALIVAVTLGFAAASTAKGYAVFSAMAAGCGGFANVFINLQRLIYRGEYQNSLAEGFESAPDFDLIQNPKYEPKDTKEALGVTGYSTLIYAIAFAVLLVISIAIQMNAARS